MIQVALIEDHQVLVDALKILLSQELGIEIAGSAGTLQEGRELLKHSSPDVLLLDILLPDGNGLDLISESKTLHPDLQVVVLTSSSKRENLMRAVALGVSGFLPKNCSFTELIGAIRKAAEGEIVMPTNMLLEMVMRTTQAQHFKEGDSKTWEDLTSREQEVLSLLAQGESSVSIAAQLCIAPLTVRTHIRNLMAKLGVHSRLEAVTFGLKNGIINSVN